MNENKEREIRQISVEDIIPNRFQPRLAFDEKELKDLSDSIKLHGIIQPLVLRPLNDKFEIIAGERRYKAACLAGLKTVPAIIMNIDDNKSAELAVVENLQRKNLTAIEEAQSYQKILNKGYITQEELAQRMGVSQPTIANKLRLLNLPNEVQDALLGNKISERHARSLLSIPDANVQVQMLRRIMTERLTVRQTDEEIAKILGKEVPEDNAASDSQVSLTPSSPTSPIQPTSEPFTASPQTPITPNSTPQQTNNDIKSIEEIINFNKNLFDTQEKPNLEDSIFNFNANDIKSQAEDIIKTPEPANIDMLLKKETPVEAPIPQTQPITEEKLEGEPMKNINLEETEANVNMGDIVDEKKIPFNPFMEDKPEIMDFFSTPEQTPPTSPSPQAPIETPNSIIDEFREQQAQNVAPTNAPTTTSNTISRAINTSRETVRNLESQGFNVETEEFDFEDMYQIIIKIKK